MLVHSGPPRCVAAVSLLFALAFVGCSEPSIVQDDSDVPVHLKGMPPAEVAMAAKNGPEETTAVPYRFELYRTTHGFLDVVHIGSRWSPQNASWYTICATKGDPIVIEVRRRTPWTDPEASLYFGTAEATGDFRPWQPRPDMELIDWEDDTLIPPPEYPDDPAARWGDPRIVVESAPYSGVYTLVVSDTGGGGATPEQGAGSVDLYLSGFSCAGRATGSGHLNWNTVEDPARRTFTFTVQRDASGSARGQWELMNRLTGTRIRGTVDCAVFAKRVHRSVVTGYEDWPDYGDDQVWAAGPVIWTNNPAVPVGSVRGFTVIDRGEGRSGEGDEVSGNYGVADPASFCQGSDWLPTFPVEEGNIQVHR